MSDIFFSYKSEDRERARIIAEALEKQGFSVWWDRTIPIGKSFDEVIKNALDAAKCVIVLWSRESILSDWVKEEASEGARRHILFPVLIDDVEIPLGFKRIQAARLVDWQGTLPNPEFDLLLNSVAEIAGRPPAQKMEEEEQRKKEEEGRLRKEREEKERLKREEEQRKKEKEERYEEKKLPAEISPTWTWGSMIASLVLIFIFWIFAGPVADSYSEVAIFQVILLILGFPATGYLMYKERTTKIKYGLAWILVPILDLLFGLDAAHVEYTAIGFLFFAIPAIIIDIVYVYKKPYNNNNK